jgi:hypothetical protein
MITINIAGLPIGIDNRFSHIVIQAKDYFTEQEPVFTVNVTDEEIKEEMERSETKYYNGYYESIISYRKIAERLPDYDAFLFHGCVIEYGGLAYIITAASGVGKTTHMRLWLKEFPGEVSVLNGDKPTVRIIDGVPYAFGTPWQGKECYGKNASAKIGGIIFLSRAEKNTAKQISESEASTRFVSQIYLPKTTRSALVKTMLLADKTIKSVKLISLECNMEGEAAHVARAAILG